MSAVSLQWRTVFFFRLGARWRMLLSRLEELPPRILTRTPHAPALAPSVVGHLPCRGGVSQFFFLRALFPSLRGTWNRTILLRCTGAPGSQRNPAPTREVADNGRCEGGRVWSAGQDSRREFSWGRARSVRSAGRDWRLNPSRGKVASTLHMHTPAESVLCARHHHALYGTVSRVCVCVASGAVALCRHANETN